jgi:thioredoxin 1
MAGDDTMRVLLSQANTLDLTGGRRAATLRRLALPGRRPRDPIMDEFHPVSDQTFEKEVLQSGTPVLVEFGADWCQPCRKLEPIVAELAHEWGDRVKLAKLNVDESVETTVKYDVYAVPTLMLFVDGTPRETLKGFHLKKKILEKLTPHLGDALPPA